MPSQDRGQVGAARELGLSSVMYLDLPEKGICQSLARLQVRLTVLKQ
jgi:hypothetical protein